MKILLCTVPFAPLVGGIETVSALLAEGFDREGHDVVVVTRTPSPKPDAAPYRIVRQPAAGELMRWHRWADVVFHNNIGLRWAWPLLLVRRPWVVAHHTWLDHGPTRAPVSFAKRWATRLARNIAVSDALARSLPGEVVIVPNPYAHHLFRRIDGVLREGDLVFLGRLVSDKGVAVLIDALGLLHGRGVPLNLTVIGDGPDAPSLQRRAAALGVAGAVHFLGRHTGEDLVRLLNGHRVCIVPSVWEEPFGLVAIEALACGCVPVVARSGGLPDAVGPCGVIVPKGDPAALAEALELLHRQPSRRAELLSRAEGHLARHRAESVARRYLEVLAAACTKLRRGDRSQRGSV